MADFLQIYLFCGFLSLRKVFLGKLSLCPPSVFCAVIYNLNVWNSLVCVCLVFWPYIGVSFIWLFSISQHFVIVAIKKHKPKITILSKSAERFFRAFFETIYSFSYNPSSFKLAIEHNSLLLYFSMKYNIISLESSIED